MAKILQEKMILLGIGTALAVEGAMRQVRILIGFVLLAGACQEPGENAGEGSETGVTSLGTSTSATGSTTVTDPVTSGSSTGTADGSGSGADTSGITAGSESAGEASGSAGDSSDSVADTAGEAPVACGGTIYACGDGQDNDGDGFIDLLDPECTGPCDDDERSFATGIPGDNKDCKQDCFFDGNSGQGDDSCDWNLRCDPENPGADIGCEYRESNSCSPEDFTQSETCLNFCIPLTPPGCDCFGCCLVDTTEGQQTIFLNSHPDCALDNLAACQSCTQSTDCMNDCDAANCERCFGDEELPPECEGSEQMCDSGTACEDSAECDSGGFCLLGCCIWPVG